MGFVCYALNFFFLAESGCQATKTPRSDKQIQQKKYLHTGIRAQLSDDHISLYTKTPRSVFPQLPHVCGSFIFPSPFCILVCPLVCVVINPQSTYSGRPRGWPLMLDDHFTSTRSHCSNSVQRVAACKNTHACLNHGLYGLTVNRQSPQCKHKIVPQNIFWE